MCQFCLSRVDKQIPSRAYAKAILRIHTVDKVFGGKLSNLVEDPYWHEGARRHGSDRSAIVGTSHRRLKAGFGVHVSRVNRCHSVFLRMSGPCLDHTLCEALIQATVLIKW